MDISEICTVASLVAAFGSAIVTVALLKHTSLVKKELKLLEPLLRSQVSLAKLVDMDDEESQTRDLCDTLDALENLQYRRFSLLPPKGAYEIIDTCRQFGIRVDYNQESEDIHPRSNFF